MIYSVSGELAHQEPGLAVVECGGVGYACRTTLQTLSQLGRIGSHVKLYTYLSVRDDGVDLFGFASQQELSCFRMLLSVSGVGPKAALTILSDATPERFALLVATGDSKALTKTKGIGTKTAQRIVLELRDKITGEQASLGVSGLEEISLSPESGSVGEAVAALVVLGYSQSEAASALAKLDASLSAPELIRLSLKELAKNIL